MSVGILAVIVAAVLAVWATLTYTQDIPLSPGSWVTMRWLTGLVGLAGITWVMLYPMRKQVYRRRAGALRYWMLSHIYLGVVAGVVLLVHGGTTSGGLLTTSLMISFDLVIASGIFGAACYVIVPRFMTRIEREPLLVEDLEKRRARASCRACPHRRRNVRIPSSRMSSSERCGGDSSASDTSCGNISRQEDLAAMLASARGDFKSTADGMNRTDDARLMQAVENAATLRRVDALVYLHYLLKVWLAPHVLFTSMMLVLMVIHIVQVVYFNVR